MRPILFDESAWQRHAFDMLKHWHEFCRATARGATRRSDDELFVAQQVWSPNERALAIVDPDTRHISVLGVGLHPQLRELHRLAIHAFRSGLGEVLFPPLTVRLNGVETRFLHAGHASIFAFADTGAPPSSKERAVVLAGLPSGFTLAAIDARRAVLIAQGQLSAIAGLDLDDMDIWGELPTAEVGVVRMRSTDLRYMQPAFSNQPGRVRLKSRGAPLDDDPARLEATLVAALRASIIEEIPIGTRGRRELGDFIVDVVRLAVRGEPDFTGSAREVAAWMGKTLRRAPRSARATSTSLALLVAHGERHTREELVSRPSPHRWTLHLRELVNEDGRVRQSLFSRWSALHAVLVGDHEPVSEDDVARVAIRGGLGGAVVKKRNEAPYMFDVGMVAEYKLRRERESELMQLRIRHADELRALAEELAQVRQERDKAVAENAQRAAQVAETDARLDRAQQRFLQRMTEFAAQADLLQGNKAVVRALHEAVARHDGPAIDALLAPDFVAHDSLERTPIDRHEFVRHLLQDAEQDPSAKDPVDFLVAEGELVAVHLHHWASSHRGAMTHGPLRIYRVADGQIAETWGWTLVRPNLEPKGAQAVEGDVAAEETAVHAGGEADH